MTVLMNHLGKFPCFGSSPSEAFKFQVSNLKVKKKNSGGVKVGRCCLEQLLIITPVCQMRRSHVVSISSPAVQPSLSVCDSRSVESMTPRSSDGESQTFITASRLFGG